MTAGTRRLWFALWSDGAPRVRPDDPLRARLAAFVRRLPADCVPVPAAGLHVTLVFLGAVPGPRVAAAVAAARGVADERADAGGRREEVRLRFDRCERWGVDGPLVLVASSPPPELCARRAALATALAAAGFTPDPRAWIPHLTLARRCRGAPPVLAEAIEWPFRGFVLAESLPAAAGSGYAVLERFGSGSPG